MTYAWAWTVGVEISRSKGGVQGKARKRVKLGSKKETIAWTEIV
jgi:hypothetical protein